jgi:hypothetical protein
MRSIGKTPFSIVYEAEAVLPMEPKYGSPRISAYNEHKLGEERLDDVNFLVEIHSQETSSDISCPISGAPHGRPCFAEETTLPMPQALPKVGRTLQGEAHLPTRLCHPGRKGWKT